MSDSIRCLGLDTECLGGGRIEHFPEKKLIKVYGHSTVSIQTFLLEVLHSHSLFNTRIFVAIQRVSEELIIEKVDVCFSHSTPIMKSKHQMRDIEYAAGAKHFFCNDKQPKK